jgi:hypothetical protein
MTDPSHIDERSEQEAQKAVRANLSPRYVRLSRLEDYCAGTQYAGMQHWIWPERDVPLAERGPHVVEPISSNAISSYQDLLLGEGRWPTIKVQSAEDDSPKGNAKPAPDVWDDSLAMAEDEREETEEFLDGMTEHARALSAAHEALGAAMSCGTVVTTIGAKLGKLVLENLAAKWCTPTWNALDPDQLDELDIRYPYTITEYDAAEKKWKRKAKLYRRTITATTDTVYEPADAKDDGAEPTWHAKAIGKGSVQHGYGFVPAHWYAFDRKLMPESERDGHAIHADLLDEIDALNRACSQHNRAALYCGDPQFVETGVAAGHNPTAMGRPARGLAPYPIESQDVKAANEQWGMGGVEAGGDRRKKGPGVVWRYDSKDVKVEVLTLPKEALEAIAMDRDDLREMIADALGWVRDREPGKAGGGLRFTGLSGEALKWMMQKQLSRCDRYRVDFGDGWILPIVRLALRIVMHHATQASGALYLAGAKSMGKTLARFVREVDNGDGTRTARWFDPPLLLDWPAYFPPTDADKSTVAKEARDDKQAGLVTLKTAVTRIEPFYQDIPASNIDEYIDELADEAEEKAKQFRAALGDMGGQDDDGGGAQRGGGKSNAGPDGAAGNAPGNPKGKATGKAAGADSAT